ncbi:MAG: LpxI family protein [Desulfovibrionales bacterium]|nr:MAG: LpxI family protein [Desulfovibrionales bacterium]
MTSLSGTLAIIAGGGRLPCLVLDGARAMGWRVVGVGFVGETEPELAEKMDAWKWLHLGQLGKLIAFCKQQGVSRIVMAGKVHKARAVDFRPDWRAAKLLWKIRNTQDDVLLRAITQELESEGLAVGAAQDFLPHLKTPEGALTRRKPTTDEQKDIDFGWPLAQKMGALDVGQCIVVRKRSTVAVEALEGTDATILRAGELVGPGCVVIKVFKPMQDIRLDLPAIGPQTIRTMIRAQASCLAVEAGRSLFLDLKESLELADSAQISIVGIGSS